MKVYLLCGAAVSSWLGLVWWLRKRRCEYLHTEKDIHKILGNACRVELSSETESAMELNALLRVYAVPSISWLLLSTGGFNTDCLRRYQDMEFLIREFTESNVLKDDRACSAVKRVNFIHAQHKISNEDMLYVLSTFFLTSARWCEKYGWRPFYRFEKDAVYEYWHAIGEQMGITGMWKSFDEADAWNRDYEAKKMRYASANYKVAVATMEYFIKDIPRFLHPLLLRVVAAMLEEDLRICLGLPPPIPGVRPVVIAGRYLRKYFVRYFLPPRPIAWEKRFTAAHAIARDGKNYYVPRGSRHGNPLYSKEGYAIQDMGPRDVEKGRLCTRFSDPNACD